MNYQTYRPTRFNNMPIGVKNLLIINGIVFLTRFVIGTKFNIDINYWLGIYYYQSESFHFWQILTHMFSHGSGMHLFFNMFALWMFGAVLENTWGTKKFILYYFVTGLGAFLVHFAIIQLRLSLFVDDPNLIYQLINTPTVGASGAIFGLLLAYGMLFPNTKLYLYFAIPIKAKWFVIGYGALELFSGIRNATGDNVAHFAHLGGMLFGFILLKYWHNKSKSRY